VGGLGLTTKTIGLMLAVQGIYSMFAQLWLFPLVVRLFGTLRAYRFVLCVWPLLYLLVPYLILLPSWLQIPAVYASLICKITFHVIAFPSNAILLANAAPSTAVLGSINGVAASTASLSRAFGPTVTGYLHSSGLKWGYSGLAWWACGIVCAIGATESLWIQEDDNDNEAGESEKVGSNDDDCEACGNSDATSSLYLSRMDSKEAFSDLLTSPREQDLFLSRSASMPAHLGDLDDILDFELPAPRTPPPLRPTSRRTSYFP
jgi:hypothetical protein